MAQREIRLMAAYNIDIFVNRTDSMRLAYAARASTELHIPPPPGRHREAKMPAACHVCHSEHFTVNEGFSYCDNCGTQSQFYQELQHDGFFASTENRQTKTATLKLATDSKNGESRSRPAWSIISLIV